MLRGLRNAFTLVEILMVVGIITLLSALLLPAVLGSEESFQKSATQNLVDSLYMAMRSYKMGNSMYPLPDEQESPDPLKSGYLVGHLRYDRSDQNRGIVNHFVDVQEFVFDTELFLGEDNLLTDPWGTPIHYVRGDSKNNNTKPGYDPDKPQDLNKPKDADMAPAKSDWNSQDERAHVYIYSEGPEFNQDSWIYYKD